MSDLDYALESTAKGAILLFIGLFSSKILTYGYRLVIARIGTSGYGLISLGLVITGILGTLAILGTNIGVHRYVAFYNARKEEAKVKGTLLSAIYITTILSIIFSALLFIFAEYLSLAVFNNSELTEVLKILSISMPFFALSNLLMYALQAFNRSDYSTYGKYITEGVTKLAAAAILIYLGYKLAGASWAYVLSLIITTLVLFFFLNKTFPLFSKLKAEYNYKELLTFSWPLVFSTIFWTLMVYINTLMLGFFRPVSEVGIYNASAPTAYLILTFPLAFGFIFLPIISMLYGKKNYSDLRKTAKITFKWNLLFSIPFFFIFTLFSKEILQLLFGADYVSGATSLIILSFGFFIYGWLSFNTELLKLIKKSKLIVAITAVSLLLNIILNVILIKAYGINGAALATTISFILYSALTTFLAVKLMKFNLIDVKSAAVFVAASISFVITFILLRFKNSLSTYMHPLLVLLFYVIIFIGIFWILIYLTKVFDKEDLVFIRIIEKKTKLNLQFLDKLFIKK